jgi:hypothetical protein
MPSVLLITALTASVEVVPGGRSTEPWVLAQGSVAVLMAVMAPPASTSALKWFIKSTRKGSRYVPARSPTNTVSGHG